jgi:pilus assembly protein CpaC
MKRRLLGVLTAALAGFLVLTSSPLTMAADDGPVTVSGSRTLTLTPGKALDLALPRDVREVLVADPKIAEVVVKTPRRAYLIGLKPGETNAFFVDETGARVAALNLRVSLDVGALREGLKTLAPHTPIKVQAVNETIMLSGEVASADVAESARQLARRFVKDDNHVVNLMRVAHPEQVLIQVKVTEMRRTVAKKLGINLLGIGGDVNLRTGIQSDGLALFDNRFGNVMVGGAVAGFRNLQAALEALEEDGFVKTLAEPNLTAMSGESANFLAGGEFPVPVGRDDQGRITIEFKPFGVGLKFTPVVLDGGRISMRISTEVSSISNDTAEGALTLADTRIPALMVRRAETTVEIPSGGSLVLGGLLRNDAANESRGLPGLGKLPVIGQLFRSDDFRRQESELVVIAVPYIVRPTRPSQLSGPSDEFKVADDLERIFLGRLYARRPGGAASAAAKGPVGYILD